MSTEHFQRAGGSPDQSHAWQSQMNHCMTSFEDTVRDNPMGVTLAAFGLGLGIGAIIGASLAPSPRSRHQQLATSLGTRMLESIRDVMPESVQQYIRS